MVSAATVLSACSTKSNEPSNQSNNPAPAPTTQDPNAVVDGGTFTIGSFSDITTLNPITSADTASSDVMKFIFSSLYDYNKNFDLEVNDRTDGAELPKVSADGLTYTVKLKSGLKWSDGSPLNADDYVITYQLLANKETGSPGYSGYEGVKEIKKVDDTTIEITLKEPDSRFIWSTNITPVPYKIFKDVKPVDVDGHAFGKDPAKTLYNGPYIWKEWNQKQYHKLERNTNFAGKKANIQEVIFKIYADQNTEVQALVAGEIDFISTVPVATLPAVTGKPGVKISENLGQSYDYLMFNFKDSAFPQGKTPFAGAKTRQAIGHAINRKGMIDSVLQGHGTPLNGPFLPNSWANDPSIATGYEYNVETAKKLLAEDGWKAGADGILVKDGIRFEFDLMTNSGNKRREGYIAVIQQNLAEVGIKVNLKPVDFSAIVDNYTKTSEFHALVLGWSLNSPDPDSESVFSSKYPPPAGQNSGLYKNEKTDQLWVDGYRTADQAKRKAVYAEILKEFKNDPPYIFLGVQNVMTTYRERVHFKDADQPVQSVSGGYLFHVHDWWVTK